MEYLNRFSAGLFALASLATATSLAVLMLQTPSAHVPDVNAAYYRQAVANPPAGPAVGNVAVAVGDGGSPELADRAPALLAQRPESDWQRQRELALWVERRNAEMMPITPGVSPDHYAQGVDDERPPSNDDEEE